jgi:hypothetical protein
MNLRSMTLYIIGFILQVAVSPDAVDGLSDDDYDLLVSSAPILLNALKYSGLAGILALPPDFMQHYYDQVLPEIGIIRANPAARNLARKMLGEVMNNPTLLNDIYTYRGKPPFDTFSDILMVASETTLGPKK